MLAVDICENQSIHLLKDSVKLANLATDLDRSGDFDAAICLYEMVVTLLSNYMTKKDCISGSVYSAVKSKIEAYSTRMTQLRQYSSPSHLDTLSMQTLQMIDECGAGQRVTHGAARAEYDELEEQLSCSDSGVEDLGVSCCSSVSAHTQAPGDCHDCGSKGSIYKPAVHSSVDTETLDVSEPREQERFESSEGSEELLAIGVEEEEARVKLGDTENSVVLPVTPAFVSSCEQQVLELMAIESDPDIPTHIRKATQSRRIGIQNFLQAYKQSDSAATVCTAHTARAVTVACAPSCTHSPEDRCPTATSFYSCCVEGGTQSSTLTTHRVTAEISSQLGAEMSPHHASELWPAVPGDGEHEFDVCALHAEAACSAENLSPVSGNTLEITATTCPSSDLVSLDHISCADEDHIDSPKVCTVSRSASSREVTPPTSAADNDSGRYDNEEEESYRPNVFWILLGGICG